MRHQLLIATAALLALAACGKKEADAPKADASASAGWNADSDNKQVVIEADSDTGKLAMQLPGGIEADLKLPPAMAAKMAGESKFDIDGVGTYPGATVKTMKVQATEKGADKRAVVDISFAAPDAPAKVADWYEKAFADKGRSVTRAGDVLTGTTEDGNPFTLTISPAATGSTGQIRIVDTKKS